MIQSKIVLIPHNCLKARSFVLAYLQALFAALGWCANLKVMLNSMDEIVPINFLLLFSVNFYSFFFFLWYFLFPVCMFFTESSFFIPPIPDSYSLPCYVFHFPNFFPNMQKAYWGSLWKEVWVEICGEILWLIILYWSRDVSII